jgi:hypothetical protein
VLNAWFHQLPWPKRGLEDQTGTLSVIAWLMSINAFYEVIPNPSFALFFSIVTSSSEAQRCSLCC